MKTKLILFSMFLLVSAAFLTPALFYGQGDRVMKPIRLEKKEITLVQDTSKAEPVLLDIPVIDTNIVNKMKLPEKEKDFLKDVSVQTEILRDSFKKVLDSLETSSDSLKATTEKNKELNEFRQLLLGGIDGATYLACFIFAFIGMFIRWVFVTLSAMKKSGQKFDLKYWLHDNFATKIFTGIGIFFILFITFRFAYEFTGVYISVSYALLLGLSGDYGIDKWLKAKPASKEVKPEAN